MAGKQTTSEVTVSNKPTQRRSRKFLFLSVIVGLIIIAGIGAVAVITLKDDNKPANTVKTPIQDPVPTGSKEAKEAEKNAPPVTTNPESTSIPSIP